MLCHLIVDDLMDIPEQDITAIINWASSMPIITRAWVFGSRIKGTSRIDSDLDVAIEHGAMKGDTNAYTTAIVERSKWQKELQSRVSLTLDLQSYIPGHSDNIEKYLSEASVLIYEKTI